jgi:hypothetical protein
MAMEASREERLTTLPGVPLMSWGKQRPGDEHGPGGVDLDLGEEVRGTDLERAVLAGCRAEGPGVGPGGVDQQVDVATRRYPRGEPGDQFLVGDVQAAHVRAARGQVRRPARHPAHTSSPCSR